MRNAIWTLAIALLAAGNAYLALTPEPVSANEMSRACGCMDGSGEQPVDDNLTPICWPWYFQECSFSTSCSC